MSKIAAYAPSGLVTGTQVTLCADDGSALRPGMQLQQTIVS